MPKALDPKSSVSTSSTTLALLGVYGSGSSLAVVNLMDWRGSVKAEQEAESRE